MTLAVRSPEWLVARREAITSTDIPILLGLSPYKAEGQLAREKLGATQDAPDQRQARLFRLGLALEEVIRDEDELEHGVKLRRVNRFLTHPQLAWARTSLDFERVGERCIVEAKSSRATRWDDGLPQDVEAQVRWQMGVAGYPRAHVAALRHGSELACFDVTHDEATFDGLVQIAADFRRRLAEGGPFAESLDSLKARYPRDDGETVAADADVAEAVRALLAVRASIAGMEADEERLKVAIQTRMGDAAVMTGDGFRVVWKRTKDTETPDWRAIADSLLTPLPEPERVALVGKFTAVRSGFRPFRVVAEKEGSA